MDPRLIYSIIGSILVLLGLFLFYFYQQTLVLKAENENLVVSKNNFETISKKANDIILTIDIINGTIYNANNQASEILGYTITDLCSKTIHDLHPQDMLDISAQNIAAVWEQKGMVYQNLPFITSKGELIDVECSAKVLIYDEKPVIIIYARDIRERLMLEREVQVQNQLIVTKNKNITDSINYARKIQNAVFGNPEKINKLFEKSFVYFKPRSIVSGDFYWFYEWSGYKIAIAADCTGHGVPGAFMTLLACNILEEIIDSNKIMMPDLILHELNQRLASKLRNESSDKQLNDGMDIAILCFEMAKNKVYFSSAKNPLCIVQNNKIELIKSSKDAIGGQIEQKNFDRFEFEFLPETTFYIYSDGFQDQFGGKDNRKYLGKNFRDLLLDISKLDMDQQMQKLDEQLDEWKGQNPQTDDILIVGIQV